GLATGCASGNVACWTGKLADPSPFARTRAAMELGRTGKAEVIPALVEAIQKPLDGATNEDVANQDEARFAAILAMHWILDAGGKPADPVALGEKLDKQVEGERSKTATMRSAEDVKRLSVRIKHAS